MTFKLLRYCPPQYHRQVSLYNIYSKNDVSLLKQNSKFHRNLLVSLAKHLVTSAILKTEMCRSTPEGSSVLRRVFRNPSLRTALLVGCSLQMIQQLAGINTVMYYSASIIKMSGVREKSTAIWLSSATSGVNCVCSFLTFFFVERVGRRKLTLASLAGVILSLIVLALSFQLTAIYSPPVTHSDPSPVKSVCYNYSDCNSCTKNSDCGYCFTAFPNATYEGTCLVTAQSGEYSEQGACNTTTLPQDITWAYEWCPSSYSWITFLGLLLYLFFFAPGMGSMPWTINSEIYPLWARSTCYSMATSVNWFCNFLVSLTFLYLMQAITKYGAFYLYSTLALLGFIFLFLMLPETKGVSLEDVENLFAHPWWKDATTIAEKKTVQCPQVVQYSSTLKNAEELEKNSF